MSNINIGSAVRLKGDRRIMTVIDIVGDQCTVNWTIEGDKINEKIYNFRALESVPEMDLNREKENMQKLFDAKLRSAKTDNLKKLGTTFAAILSALALFYQAFKIGDIEKNLENLVRKNQSRENSSLPMGNPE
ncbi:hypothetical protein [Leptospira levettii]|uniref:Uncharacterized protein n=1 Tax=Leptospira levettii TaxID=2023178 RepID=A0ABY2MU51_9LEPT|nr:hypothetical protein [Leptospira levettii]TGL75429.1 hypothetical protein EHQ60_00460 [Leptospira levettii]